MYSTPQRTPAPAQKGRTAQLIVTGIVALVIVGWFFRDSNLITYIKNMVWEVRKVTTSEAQLYIEEGTANHQKGDYEAAVVSFSKAIELEPDNYMPYNGRAKAYSMIGDAEKCKADLDKAIELAPDVAQNYFDRPYMFFQLMDREDVYADLSKAIELKPDYYSPRLFRAMLYEEDGKWAESIADYQVAIERMPDDTPQDVIYNIYMGQANGYLAQGMYPEAVANYNSAFEQAPQLIYMLQKQEAELQNLLKKMEPGSEAYNELEALLKKLR